MAPQPPPAIVPIERQDPEEIARRRRGRNWALLIVLLVLCLVFYAITWVKMTKS